MPSFVGAREIAGLLGAGRNLLTGAGFFYGPELFQQGRSGSLLDRGVQNLPGIIPDPRTDAGRNLGRMLSNELRYVGGQLNRGQIPYTQPSAPAQRPPMPGLPADYKQTELAAGAAAERSRPGAGFPGQQGMFTPAAPGPGTAPPAVLDPYAAQNRAYQQERARVEAMVKANPDMQKQEIADARAKVRDQGMAIWAAKNPELAKKLQPGQVGYDAVQQALLGNEAGEAMRQGYGFQVPQQVVMTPPPGVNAPQGLSNLQSFGGAEAYGAQGLQVDPEMAKKFQALLNQAKA